MLQSPFEIPTFFFFCFLKTLLVLTNQYVLSVQQGRADIPIALVFATSKAGLKASVGGRVRGQWDSTWPHALAAQGASHINAELLPAPLAYPAGITGHLGVRAQGPTTGITQIPVGTAGLPSHALSGAWLQERHGKHELLLQRSTSMPDAAHIHACSPLDIPNQAAWPTRH